MWVYILLFFVILFTIFSLICLCCNENEPHFYELDKKQLAPPKKEEPKMEEPMMEVKADEENKEEDMAMMMEEPPKMEE